MYPDDDDDDPENYKLPKCQKKSNNYYKCYCPRCHHSKCNCLCSQQLCYSYFLTTKKQRPWCPKCPNQSFTRKMNIVYINKKLNISCETCEASCKRQCKDCKSNKVRARTCLPLIKCPPCKLPIIKLYHLYILY